MENQIAFGVANSISANQAFDPLDTIAFACNHGFRQIQIYLTQKELGNERLFALLREAGSSNGVEFIFHAEGYLNEDFLKSPYSRKLRSFLEAVSCPSFILHFDEQVSVDQAYSITMRLANQGFRVHLENYFRQIGPEKADLNLKKYLAIFTLLNSGKPHLWPVLDLPRFFHPSLGFTQQESLAWCFQLCNYFNQKNQPILFHLIDTRNNDQKRNHFCPVLEGVLPYPEIFRFMKKTSTPIQSLLFEYEDKLNPLRSRENILHFWEELNEKP